MTNRAGTRSSCTASENARKALHKTDWNHYTVRAMGDHITLGLGGAQSVDYHETDSSVARSGLLAVQIHAGGPMEVQFKDVMIQELPTPTAENPDSPGFHLRTLKTEQGERKYTVYVPQGYDGSRVYPVILFLHGAGERGQDGIVPAQVGLGPAILHRPVTFRRSSSSRRLARPGRPIQPTARPRSRRSADVMTAYATDPKRVVLTGLSMGGRGSWELAAAHPEHVRRRRADLRPGPARPGSPSMKGLPVWSFCGDADRDSTVLNMRAMIEALEREGHHARLTEYRGVGHNSWDRAYNDPELIEWMLAQRKP